MENKRRNQSAGDILRFWRKRNGISQLDLALDTDISSKHLSFVETGKSQPSRDLILRLAHSLKLPFRHRNAFLKAAGFAPEFAEEPFDGQKMEIVRKAFQRMLKKHEPYPAFVINTGYTILMTNAGFQQIMTFYLGENALKEHSNVYLITFQKDGLRKYIENWSAVERFMLGRLWEEAIATQNDQLFELYEEVSKLRDSREQIDFQIDSSLPVMNLTLEKDSVKARFFTTITTIGTPLDLTTQELRMESLFPADEETKKMFHGTS